MITAAQIINDWGKGEGPIPMTWGMWVEFCDLLMEDPHEAAFLCMGRPVVITDARPGIVESTNVKQVYSHGKGRWRFVRDY